jgi:hypothetical protein
MEEQELYVSVKLSLQRALLGAIYPSIRGIAFGYDGLKKLTLVCYLDREPNDEDKENLSDISGYVLGDIEFEQVEEICLFDMKSGNKLNSFKGWVYFRKES